MALGNPGPEYETTRHNAGFILADHLASRWNWKFRREGNARVARGTRGQPIELIKPQTYMNRSGAVLAPFRAQGTGFDPSQDLLVLVDDFALPLGRFRLRAKGSAGGHNGLKSIEGTLRGQEYARLRIGVGPLPPEFNDSADFVLESFLPEETRALVDLLDPMAEAVETWLSAGIDVAMNRHNRAGSKLDGSTDDTDGS